jgi:hypothetical protein
MMDIHSDVFESSFGFPNEFPPFDSKCSNIKTFSPWLYMHFNPVSSLRSGFVAGRKRTGLRVTGYGSGYGLKPEGTSERCNKCKKWNGAERNMR